MKLFYLTILLLFSYYCNAQKLNDYKNRYPQDDAVTTSLKRHIDISKNKNGLSIKEYVSNTDYYITNNFLHKANESVSYNTFNSIIKIDAKTENLEQEKLKYSVVNDFTDKDVLINGIFFNDQKEKNFTFSNVKKGSFTHLNYIKRINDPHFLPAFIISKSIPIETAEFSVSFPNNVEIAYKNFNLDTIDSLFEEIKDGNNTTYKWTLKSIPRINIHYDFSPLYYVPQIIIYIKSYTVNGTKKNILSNPDDLYSWYSTLISNINTTNQKELKSITLSLIKGAKTEEEKIKRIYYFVQDKINYIAFEDGLNGFIPRDAMKVFSKKYGDCKDMSNVLNEMLHYAEVHSYLTWIGTRKKPYSYNDVPTPFSDNHMITAVKLKDKFTFLDATAKYLTFGAPSPFIQGKEALIGLNKTDYKIIKIPEVEFSKNKLIIYSNLKLENNLLIGNHSVEILGYEKLHMLHKIEKKSDDDLSFLNNTLKFGTRRTSFNSVVYKNISLDKDSLIINFNSSTKGYTKSIGNKLYFKPNLDFNLKSEIVKNESKNFDKKIDYKYQKTFFTSIQIPQNHSIENLPKNTTYKNNQFNFYINYKLSEDGKQLQIEKNIIVNTLKIKTQHIDNWNDFIKLLNKANKQSIILIKH